MNHRVSTFFLFLTFALALVGCAQPGPTATPTVLASPTPTPTIPLVILLAPPESDANLVIVVSELSAAYAAANGMQFEQRSLLNPAEMPSSLEKLIVIAPDPGVAALAATAPQAQVIAIGFSPDASLANLTSLPLGGDDANQIAFIAGYIAAISAEDWRSGILYSSASAAVLNDFIAGAEYFCGSCAPVSPPFIEYPVAAQADSANWQPAADQLLAQFVKVVYLTPELEASGAAQYLASSGVLLIGSGTPPAELANSWVVSVTSDPVAALRQLLPVALEAQPLQPVDSLSLLNANANLFSESRQIYVQRIIDDLTNGYIQLPND